MSNELPPGDRFGQLRDLFGVLWSMGMPATGSRAESL